MSNVAGMPTASIATSTPAPSVSAMTLCTAVPSLLLTTFVAPRVSATWSRLSSRSIIMISAGE